MAVISDGSMVPSLVRKSIDDGMSDRLSSSLLALSSWTLLVGVQYRWWSRIKAGGSGQMGLGGWSSTIRSPSVEKPFDPLLLRQCLNLLCHVMHILVHTIQVKFYGKLLRSGVRWVLFNLNIGQLQHSFIRKKLCICPTLIRIHLHRSGYPGLGV